MVESGKRMEQLKSYLRRLSEGEILDSVRADFMREFKDVDAVEIMEAEQQMIKEGMPITEVQKLCDVHSALFHGATLEEKIANARQPVDVTSLREERAEKTRKLVETTGHPLFTLTQENEALEKVIARIREQLDRKVTEAAGTGTAVNGSRNTGENAVSRELLSEIRELAIHYAKKGDMLYPLLKVKYGVSGPSDVMWTVDDEIRDELSALAKENDHGAEWSARLDAVLTRAEEMIYKEQNILFPICAVNFTEEEWYGIYHDEKDYDLCFGVEQERWETVEGRKVSTVFDAVGEIVMPGGHMTVEQLTALLNTIPMEITFVDADNINRFFNEGPKVFKRPGMAIDREVFSCHPPKIEPMVRQIIDDFRNNRRDEVPVWMEKGGRTMLVKYMAVRDNSGAYLGTVELVQDMEFAKTFFLGENK